MKTNIKNIETWSRPLRDFNKVIDNFLNPFTQLITLKGLKTLMFLTTIMPYAFILVLKEGNNPTIL